MKVTFGEIIFPYNLYNPLKRALYLTVKQSFLFLKNNPHSKIMDFLYSLTCLMELSPEEVDIFFSLKQMIGSQLYK